MSVYFAIPSARPPEEAVPVLRQWHERGYSVLIQRDHPGSEYTAFPFAAVIHRQYSGYAEAVNHLCRWIIKADPQAEWIVTGGDDTLPDPNHSAAHLGWECSRYFQNRDLSDGTFGVMQPTGDRGFGDRQGPYIDRVAGSPWIGREFARRMYGGRGPLCEEYFHCGEDEELQAVATKLGVFWQRPDLVHHHQHWGRPKDGQKMVHNSAMPAFLARANSAEEWQKFKRIFAERKASGFPGSEPIA